MSVSFYIFIVSLLLIICLSTFFNYENSNYVNCESSNYAWNIDAIILLIIFLIIIFLTIPSLIISSPIGTKTEIFDNRENKPKIAKYIQAHWFKKDTLNTTIVMPRSTVIVEKVEKIISFEPAYEMPLE